jgi:hypothetical protein
VDLGKSLEAENVQIEANILHSRYTVGVIYRWFYLSKKNIDGSSGINTASFHSFHLQNAVVVANLGLTDRIRHGVVGNHQPLTWMSCRTRRSSYSDSFNAFLDVQTKSIKSIHC